MRAGLQHELVDWVERRAVDQRGEPVGVVVDVYADAATGKPSWLAVTTGFFGMRIVIAPVRGASLLGGDVLIPHQRELILSAPPVQAVVTIPPAEERSVIAHYGIDRPARSSTNGMFHHPTTPPTKEQSMTNTNPDTQRLIGRRAVDPTDSKIGTVSDVYVDDETGDPSWLAVNTGLFGTKVSFVPLAGAELAGDDVVVAYDKDLVKDAPRAEADGHLSPEEEAQLYAHYRGAGAGTAGGVGWRDRSEGDVSERTGYDTSGPETDDAMTRSEEELDVQKRTRTAGRARLRKWIETEDVDVRVPVRREKARLVTEPVTDSNRGAAMAGGDLTTEEHEVVLNEEVVDVDKRVVPKERVRLETETETDEVTVDEEVRKERIEMDQDTDIDRR